MSWALLAFAAVVVVLVLIPDRLVIEEAPALAARIVELEGQLDRADSVIVGLTRVMVALQAELDALKKEP